MVQKRGKRTLVTALAVLLVLLVAIATIALIQLNGHKKTDPYVSQDSTSTTDSVKDATEQPSKDETETPKPESATQSDTSPQLDPATVATVDIAPMSVTVSYVKGAGSFEYEVMRTANGTRYVVFNSTELAGTKCTNDKGTFATILASPNDNESSTLTKTTVVDGTTYGLSLESSTCTSNADKLQTYQKSFSDAFGLLKKMN